MKLNAKHIATLDKKRRVLLINSLSGFKSANLVGTCDAEQQSNLAIVSSVLHLGSNPPLLGMIMRPHSVPQGTLENIKNTGVYSLNHVHTDIYQQAHQTSACYPQDISEFAAVGLTEQWEADFVAPFVQESVIKLGMKLREQHHLAINGTELIIGEIVSIDIPDELVADDGYVLLEKAKTVAVSSLDSYHQTQLLSHLSHAKPDKALTQIQRDSTVSKLSLSYLTLGVTDFTRMQQFYTELGFSLYKQSTDKAHPFAFFKLGNIILALYPKHLLAKQSGCIINNDAVNQALSLSLNVHSKANVDKVLAFAKTLSAEITREAFEPLWGGYCGYFKDPEQNLWEIVWHEDFQP